MYCWFYSLALDWGPLRGYIHIIHSYILFTHFTLPLHPSSPFPTLDKDDYLGQKAVVTRAYLPKAGGFCSWSSSAGRLVLAV